MVLEQILRQCGDDLSRDNIIKQAKSLKDLTLTTALPGVRINTSATNNMIWTQLQLQRWTRTRWEHFGEILDASSNQRGGRVAGPSLSVRYFPPGYPAFALVPVSCA
jgi:hypothetical protein